MWPKWKAPVRARRCGGPPDAGGAGRPRRDAASASPGASKVTTGRPYVRPSKLATEPPSEWPTAHTVAPGYSAVTFAYRSSAAR